MKLSLPELNYNLGHVLHRQGNLAGAACAFQQAIALDSDFIQARHCLAVVLSEQGNDQTAVQQYRWILQRHPRATKTYHNLGVILARQSQPEAALACFQQLLQLEPDSPAAHTGCGLAYLACKQFDQALGHFYQALRPNWEQILAFCDWAAQLTGQDELTLARQACGQLLLALGSVGGSVDDSVVREADRSYADSTHPRPCRAESRSERGIVTLHSEPPNWRHRRHLGETCLHLGNLLMRYGGKAQIRQAEAYYQQALQCQPQRLELYLSLADCLIQQQRWNAAILLCRLGLTLHPDAAPLYQTLGGLLEQQQQWSEAIACYRRAWQLIDLAADSTQQLARELDQADQADQAHPAVLSQGSVVPASDPQTPITATCSSLDWAKRNSGRYWPLAVGTSLREPVHSINPPAAPSADCSSCQGLNCQPCLQEIVNQFSPTLLQPDVYACRAQTLEVKPPSYFVAQIPAGIAQITPYQTPWLVANSLAVLTPERVLLTDLSREYPGQLPTCRCEPGFPRIREAGLGRPTSVAGSVAVLAGLSGHNYFHWMVDILPRLALLRQSDWSKPDWFWINDSDLSFQRQTLDVLGVPAARLLSADRWPCIQAEQLIAPAFAGYLGWPEPWALAWLRQQFLPLAASCPKPPQRIYISRNRAHHRRLLNEAAVLEKLQAAGFVAVELETMSLAEQIALFAGAEAIVAPHGGGLTNTIFCRPGTPVIELVAPNYIRPYYWVISHHLGLRHYYIKGEPSTCPPLHQLMYPSPLLEDIWVDQAKITGLLRQLGLT
ncbi:MAG: glycosyltransferase 61 family protein [Elainella sp.]